MKKRIKHRGNFFHPVLIAAMILLLSSCIEYREEMWLEKDNSGRVVFELSLPQYTDIEDDEISELSIVALCDTVDGIDVTKHTTYHVEDITWIHVEMDFEDIMLLNEIENKWFGEISISDDDDGNRTLKRYITMSDTVNVSSNKFGNLLKHAMLGQYTWIYTMHFPDELYETNAPLARTDTLTNSAMWEYNLASLINDQKIMTGRYRHRQGLKGLFQTLFKR